MKHDKVSRAGKSASAPLQCRTNQSHRILVVDDDIGIRQLSAEVLVRFGYQVDAAEDAVAGWKALHAKNYDLLITDFDMPGLSGLKLVKRLRAAHMAVPVILASGTMTPQELNRNPWVQLSGTLLKPFSPDRLLETVREVLRSPASVGDQIKPRPQTRSQPPLRSTL